MIKINIKDFTLIRDGKPELYATVPCSLYDLLQKSGEIPNIYLRDNIKHTSVDLSSIKFVSKINLEDATVRMKHVYLTFSRIFADAEIYLNGKRQRRVHNYNRMYTVDVSGAVASGENLLEIRITKPLDERRIIGTGGVSPLEYELTPYLPDVGIIGECSLIATSYAMIDKIGIRQTHSDGRVDLSVSLDTIGECDDMRAVATLTSPAGKMYFGSVNDGVASITVTSPELWWPRGLGTPSLYKLTVSLWCNGELEDTRDIMIGLRKVELVDADDGTYMTVNGARFFPMGATYVREDAVIPFITEDRLIRMIESCADANMNTLRLVGAGLYPDNKFYSLCDKLGIMVWQDISVGYTKPPVLDSFASGVYNELCDTMARVSHHPCVVLMYLMVTARASDDEQASNAMLHEFLDTCYHIAQPIAKRFAEGIPFIMTRELLDEADERALFDEIKLIRNACFASLPPKESILCFASEEDLNPLSPVMEAHTSGKDAIAKMLVNMTATVKYPYDFDTLIYASQIASGYSVYRSVSRARLKRSGSMAAVGRQLNDSWPSVSASSVDFYGRRKALHYYSKRAFSLLFVGAHTDGARVTIGVSNETGKTFEGTLSYALYSISGKCHLESKVDLTVGTHDTSEPIEEDFSKIIAGESEKYYLVCELRGDGRRLFRSIVLFVPPKHAALDKPTVLTDITGDGTHYEMLIRSDTLALACEISFDGLDADMSDNFINISGDFYEKITVTTSRPTTADELRQRLIVHTIYDVGR